MPPSPKELSEAEPVSEKSEPKSVSFEDQAPKEPEAEVTEEKPREEKPVEPSPRRAEYTPSEEPRARAVRAERSPSPVHRKRVDRALREYLGQANVSDGEKQIAAYLRPRRI